VIVVAFADNDPQSNGTLHFKPFAGGAGCPALEASQFKADVAAKRAAGKIVALSLGGAEGNITLNTDSDEASFVSSLTGILTEWGFDGIDVDLESGSGLTHGSQIQTRLVSAIKKINTNVGGDMYLSMAPEHPYVQGGVVAFSSIWGAYLPIIDGLRDELDLLHVQLYNNSSVPTPNTPEYANGKMYPEATVDSLVVSVTMLVEGFTTASKWQFKGLPASKVAFGLPSGPSSSNSPVTSNATIESAYRCITEGTSCGEHVPSAKYPDFRGVMTWSINWDKHDNYPMSKEIGGFLHAP
jgi:chitinase